MSNLPDGVSHSDIDRHFGVTEHKIHCYLCDKVDFVVGVEAPTGWVEWQGAPYCSESCAASDAGIKPLSENTTERFIL